MKLLRGIPASPGIVTGSAQTIRPVPPVNIMEQRTVDAPIEIVRLERAIGRAIARLDKLLSASHGPVTSILGAQQEMLDDPACCEKL
jgi:phosphoenolpyruvate-protein kinase (PTS system EI component)